MANKKLYVGNLDHGITNDELQSIFETHGAVVSAQVIVDRDTNRSKGFGFVEMGSEEEAQSAVEALNSQEFNGRAITVDFARPREERPRRSGGGGGFGGGNRNDRGDRGGRRY